MTLTNDTASAPLDLAKKLYEVKGGRLEAGHDLDLDLEPALEPVLEPVLEPAQSPEDKSYKICSVLGGLDVARVVSSNTRIFFQGAIDDTELIREFVGEAMTNQGIAGGVSSLDEMTHTLDWKARGFENPTTSLEANLDYVDDRTDRRIDRFVSTANKPLVGDKETDLAIVNTVSLLFPWIVDRKSKVRSWWVDHQNGRSEGTEKEPFQFDSLYTAAWIGTYGEAWAYYPPFRLLGDGRPFSVGDVVGSNYSSHREAFVEPNLPGNNPARKAFFTAPYPDTARQGMSLITALAPIYFTGNFQNYNYSDTYIASTGVDIAVSSVSSLLDKVKDRLTELSFGILVDAASFNVIVISQSVVEMIYPERTGFEEDRVTYAKTDGSVIEDRRNQTYRVSDTIAEDLTELSNANWMELLSLVRKLRPGERDYSSLDITLTGDEGPTEFYVMYERWKHVADWALMIFAPTKEVENAINVEISSNGTSINRTASVSMRGEMGRQLAGEATIFNNGNLDVAISPKATPSWLRVNTRISEGQTLRSGGSLRVQFDVVTRDLDIGTVSAQIPFNVKDDDYPDCFYNQDISLSVSIRVSPKDCVTITGDKLRRPDSVGNCVCEVNALEIGGKCVSYGVVLPSLLFPLLIIGLFLIHMYVERKRKQADSVWEVKTSELSYDDPPVIAGRGTFGLVLLAEYRGTQVAVKRVIPPRQRHKGATEKQQRRSSLLDLLGNTASSFGTTLSVQRRRSSGYMFDFDDEGSQEEDRNRPLEGHDTNESKSRRRSIVPPTKSKSRGAGGRAQRRPSSDVIFDFDPDECDDEDESHSGEGLLHGQVTTAPSSESQHLSKSLADNRPKAHRRVSTGMMSGTVFGTRAQRSRPYSAYSIGYGSVSRPFSFKLWGRKSDYSQHKADFVEEMRHLSKLRHPCITTVMGAVISRGEEPLLIMEYMDHGSLYDLLQNDTMVLEGELVLPILRDIAQGLRFLHAASPQVIHGDLKSANVLVDSKFRGKVADFGLSIKRKIGASGTPFWMAPELLRGDGGNTAATDVFSFGILLFEVYSRNDPYEGEDYDEVIQSVCDPTINKRPPVPSAMPSEVASLLMLDSLDANPEARPSFDELDSFLKRFQVENVEPGRQETSFTMHHIRKARDDADRNAKLLNEIFPKHVADALRNGRKVEPEHFDCITCFFSDIVGYTTLSSSMSPMKVSDMLHRLYSKFDALSDEHDVFKVETIGDAWVGVTNLSRDQDRDHAKRIAEFSIDAIAAANETLVDEEDLSKGFVSIRVGFHSGPVLANVVGSRMPKYTLFGDTVNTSSRMESNSMPCRIHCSDRTADLLKKQAPEIPLAHRGEISIKGKGMMNTYWVNEMGRPRGNSTGSSSSGEVV